MNNAMMAPSENTTASFFYEWIGLLVDTTEDVVFLAVLLNVDDHIVDGL